MADGNDYRLCGICVVLENRAVERLIGDWTWKKIINKKDILIMKVSDHMPKLDNDHQNFGRRVPQVNRELLLRGTRRPHIVRGR